MKTDLSVARNGDITMYVGGKKVLRGTLAQIAEYLAGSEAPQPKPKRERPKSRAARWSDACGKARDGLEELQGLKEEFEEWRDNLPENLQQTALGEKLEAVCDLDIDSAIDTVEEADSMDLPMGFGRD